jgi:hypothetical protein
VEVEVTLTLLPMTPKIQQVLVPLMAEYMVLVEVLVELILLWAERVHTLVPTVDVHQHFKGALAVLATMVAAVELIILVMDKVFMVVVNKQWVDKVEI